jgi:hypothetical protein
LPALQLDQFPIESIRSAQTLTSPEAAAAYLITAANLLKQDVIRRAFQQDPLVRTGRAAIAEFTEAPFGPNTSVIAQRELSSQPPTRPARETTAVAATLPRDQWHWQVVEGLEYKDSEADLLPGDPPLSFRFALTWDHNALYFSAEVTDNLPGYKLPLKRNRLMELFVDPAGDGLVWTGPKDYQFTYRLGDGTKELFNQVPCQARIAETTTGYTVDATIPWSSLGLVPAPGLSFGLSPAAISEGVREWDPMIKLNWSYATQFAGNYRLGRVRLL